MKGLILILFCLIPYFLFSQKKAENYGGKSEKNRIFEQELYYPPNSIEKYYGGKVELEFDLDESGLISNINVIKSVSRELNAEAIRLLKLMIWEPAKEDGEPLSSHEKISFKFNPGKYSALCKKRGYELERPAREFTFRVYDEKELTKKPEFVGTENNFQNYVKENLKYPEAALNTEAQGIVEILFVIEPSGRMTNIHVAKGLEANCNIVAKNLILNSKWKPGNLNGIPVRTIMSRKIYFSPKGNLRFITIPDQD